MEIVNKVHESNLIRWAQDKPDVVVYSGDLTGSVEIAGFRDAYPDRFFNFGMAEQNMLSWAGGMAREGFTPLLHTFAVFMYRRPLDQLSMSVCYPNLRVRLFGFLPGVSTPGGVTHQAIDDVGVLRAIPNMTIFEVGDATEIETILDPVHAVDGPVYVRMLRGQVPRLFPRTEPLEFGKARVLSSGSSFAIISTGNCTEEAMRATAVLQDRGISITHLHVSTLKPFNDHTVLEAVATPEFGVITFENHSVMGGVGTAVAEMMAEHGIGKPLLRLGLQDTYAHGASFGYLKMKYGLDANGLVRAVGKLLDQPLDITSDELANARLTEPALSSSEQLEAL